MPTFQPFQITFYEMTISARKTWKNLEKPNSIDDIAALAPSSPSWHLKLFVLWIKDFKSGERKSLTTNMKSICHRCYNFHVKFPVCRSNVLKSEHVLFGGPVARGNINHLGWDIVFAIAYPKDTIRARRSLFPRVPGFPFGSRGTRRTRRAPHAS